MTIKRNAMGVGTPASQAGALVGGVTNNVTATGSTQATAALLNMGSNNVVTVGAGSTGVILPPGNVVINDQLAAGDYMRVYNAVSGNAINVYPPLGGKINGGTTNAAVSLAALKPAEFVCIDGLNFFANISA